MTDFYTTVKERLAPGPARVVLMTKSGLIERIDDVAKGEAASDFYYNFPDLVKQKYDVRMLNTASDYPGLLGKVHRFFERVYGRITGISRRHHYLELTKSSWRDADVIMSFTDHFSLTLGDYFRGKTNRPNTIGVFHGLSDFGNQLTDVGRKYADTYMRQCLQGLDVVCFMGPADREEGINRFGLPREQTDLLVFGVDTNFWHTAPDDYVPREKNADFRMITVGSDPSRDFETLLQTDLPGELDMVTRLPVADMIREGAQVNLVQGSYWNTKLTDAGLREMYWDADAVVVPLVDVYQPTGYSVTLQAMACGIPVILTDIVGLWAPELYVDGKNCLLVPPNDPEAISLAAQKLKDDPAFAQELAKQGRKLIEESFALQNMNDSMRTVIERFSQPTL
jgi:glycosyltransferase involved in cell wall biosynthesis